MSITKNAEFCQSMILSITCVQIWIFYIRRFPEMGVPLPGKQSGKKNGTLTKVAWFSATARIVAVFASYASIKTWVLWQPSPSKDKLSLCDMLFRKVYTMLKRTIFSDLAISNMDSFLLQEFLKIQSCGQRRMINVYIIVFDFDMYCPMFFLVFSRVFLNALDLGVFFAIVTKSSEPKTHLKFLQQ